MKLRKYSLPSLAIILFISTFLFTYYGTSAKTLKNIQIDNKNQIMGAIDITSIVRDVRAISDIKGDLIKIVSGANPLRAITGNDRSISYQQSPLSVYDFFLTEDELPSPWIPEPGTYTPGAYMMVKEKLMGGDWWSVRIRNTDLTKGLHVTIGYFPSEAEATYYADPDTYIFSTDAYNDTGQTFTEMLQAENSQYSLSGGTIYGDGGFSGGYQHLEFQPFNVFRVGKVLIHTDASDPSGEGILEQLLVNKARQLLGSADSTDVGIPTTTASAPQLSTLTPQVQTDPIILKASLDGKGDATLTIPNRNNFAVITINGVVTDQDGNGVSGATIEVIGGAEAASTRSNPDGGYSLAVNVQGGQDSGAIQGMNFSLQVGDLSIDRIVLLQAIEGGQMVTYRDVGVRIFLNWGLDEPVDVEVTITVDNQTLPVAQGVAKKNYTQKDRNRGTDAVNFIIPKDQFPSWGDSTHSLTAQVAVVSPDIVDVDPNNNISAPQNFSLKNTRSLSILYVSLDQSINKSALVNFAAQAHSFLDKVYPISYSWGFVGNSQVSYYLVSPYVDFLKAQDPDSIPFNLGDIGIVEGGLEIGKSFSYKSAIIAIEKARRLYNSQRCKDTTGKVITPCTDEIALQTVGVFPDGAFGSSKDGFAYADYRNKWRAAANSLAKPDNVAHELGHLFGFGEEYSSTSSGVPITGSTWDGVKFQTANESCVNIMGNMSTACTWINSQTWNSLIENSLKYGATRNRAVASRTMLAPLFEPLNSEVQSPALMVEGVVTSAGEGFLEQVSRVDRYMQSNNQGGQFKLEARDASGISIGAVQFEGLFTDLGINAVSVSPFMVVLPVNDPDQVVEIIFTKPDGQIVDTILRTTSIPVVSFDPLPAAIQDQATITWQASDADGDTLKATLYYSNDGGIRWQLLGLDMPVNTYSLNATELPGGSAFFKVNVSDGFNSAESVSMQVSMPDQPPIVSIIEPWGVEFENQDMVSLEALAYDLEDGMLPSSAIQWFDTQGSLLGTGVLLQTNLPQGEHTINLHAVDSSGQSGTAIVNITVQSLSTDVTGDDDKILPSIKISEYLIYILGSGACLIVFAGVIVGGIIIFSRRRRNSNVRHSRVQSHTSGQIQDQQGRWWYQDPNTGSWSIWDDNTWLSVPGSAPNIAAPLQNSVPQPYSPRRKPGSGSCLLTIGALIILGLLVVGSISLVAFEFFPGTQIQLGQGDLTEILKKGGGGLLVTIMGMFLLNGGFKAIITRRAVVEDEWGRKREKRGCGAILNGLGQLFFGVICLTGGLGLITLAFYQEVLPWFGF